MTLSRSILRSTLFAAMALGASGPIGAEEPADEKARAAEFAALAQQDAESYKFRSDSTGALFRLRAEPILKWSNPVVGSIYGNIYIWTDRGRPEVVASIHKWYAPFRHRSHEFMSLSLGSFAAEREGQVAWTSGRPGVVLKPLPEAPAPAGTPALRLRQMRELVKEFTARQTDRQDIDRDLRLLAQPVYRYEGTAAEVVDGALFAFVLGTDPEVIVMLEARQSNGALQWQYALARLNSIHLRVSYRGSEVWSVPTILFREVYNHSDQPYTNFRFDPVEAAEKPECR